MGDKSFLQIPSIIETDFQSPMRLSGDVMPFSRMRAFAILATAPAVRCPCSIQSPIIIMQIARRVLFRGDAFEIGYVAVNPSSLRVGEVECQAENVIVLPLSGAFAKHDTPRWHSIATPNHSIFIAAGAPYRISYPAGIGDRCLTFRFCDEVMAQFAPDLVAKPRLIGSTFASCGLLPAPLVLARRILWNRLSTSQLDPLELEELSSRLLTAVLRVLSQKQDPTRREDPGGRRRAVEVVKEAVSLNPGYKWTLKELARLANVSPYHLSHLFQRQAGIPVYRYTLQTRLAKALDAVLDTSDSLTAIALEAGFSSHSHFTSAFRRLFGLTPMEVRRRELDFSAALLSKILTADCRCN